MPSTFKPDSEEPLQGMSQLSHGSGRLRVPFHDEDDFGNVSHLVTGFPRIRSGMFRFTSYMWVLENFV